MNNTGIPINTVENLLKDKLKTDLVFSNGTILGSMCSMPHELSYTVFTDYLDRNIGDPGLCPGLQDIESECISMLSSLLSGNCAEGSLVTGGTEANILAMWTMKELFPQKNKVILPETAHFSFDKAARMLGLELVKIAVDDQYRVIADHVEKAIDENTAGIVGIAGTTGLGTVDPIRKLSEIAEKHKLYLHIDAAFGGFVLPFLVDAGYQSAEFDFSLPGVWSITIDPHKMGRSAIPAGAILYRDRKTADAAAHQVTYLAGGKTSQRTIVGTRSGASTASVWAVMTHLGKEGYTAIVKKCMDRTMELADRISKIPGFDIVTEPVMNVIGVRHTDIPVQELVQKLRNRRWAVSEFPGFFRIVLMPHVTSAMCEDFLQILSVVSQEMSREE